MRADRWLCGRVGTVEIVGGLWVGGGGGYGDGMRLWLASAIMMGLPAIAEAQATSQCQTFGSTVNCQYQPAPTRPSLNWGAAGQQPDIGRSALEGYERGQQQRAMREQMRAQAEAQQAASQEAEINAERRRWVGRTIAEGKCSEAVGYALDNGMMELAQQAQQICKDRVK